MKLHQVEVRIPAVITLRGKVRAESPEAAKDMGAQEVAHLLEEFASRPVLEGLWPNVLGDAKVTAEVVTGKKATVSVKG